MPTFLVSGLIYPQCQNQAPPVSYLFILWLCFFFFMYMFIPWWQNKILNVSSYIFSGCCPWTRQPLSRFGKWRDSWIWMQILHNLLWAKSHPDWLPSRICLQWRKRTVWWVSFFNSQKNVFFLIRWLSNLFY